MTSPQLICLTVKSFSFWIRNIKTMPTFTTFIEHSIETPSQSNLIRKRNEGNQIRKKVKLSLFVDNIFRKGNDNPVCEAAKETQMHRIVYINLYRLNILTSIQLIHIRIFSVHLPIYKLPFGHHMFSSLSIEM